MPTTENTERLQRRLRRVTEHRDALWRHWMEAEADEQAERSEHLVTLAKAAQMERQLVELRERVAQLEAQVEEVQRIECEEWRLATGCLTPEHARRIIVSASNVAWPPATVAPAPAEPATPARFIAVPAAQVNGRPAESVIDMRYALDMAAERNRNHEMFDDDFDRFGAIDAKAWPWAVVDTQPPPAEVVPEEPQPAAETPSVDF